jgi:hypothetical protein
MKELWLGVLLGIVAPALTAKALVLWDFETDESAWRPRASTVNIQRMPAVGATDASRASLKVTGIVADGYNYILSSRVQMQEKQWYRLTGWVRVDMVGRETPMPYFKCEFLARDSGTRLGMAVTDKYHDVRIGLWQKLSVQFETPAGTVAGIVALEKGTGALTEIRAFVDDVSLSAISETEIYRQYSIPGLPKTLASVRGVHPRLYLTDQRVEELRRSVQTTHAGLWSEVRKLADDLTTVNPPQYTASSTDPGQLWQRPVGNAMPYLALAYRLTGQTRYLDAAKRWALASCSYPEWGIGFRNSTDLAAGHQLFGLALVYDWCYHDLDQPLRDRIRSTLASRGALMFQTAAKERLWWHRLYMHNHMWVSLSGLGAAGLAIFDEEDDAQLWIGMALQKFGRTMEILGPDGASHEGVGYWQYGAEHMLKFMHLAKDLLDTDFYDTSWWKNTARYSLYLTLPRSSWSRYNSAVDLADSPRHHWYGPDHILRHLAATYGDGYAQWLADQIDTANVESSNAQWLNLIWYDPTVAIRPPQTLATLRQFADMGIVSTRTGWTGDENLVVFKCGPFIGHKAVMEFSHDPGGGHSHPDAGHFSLFANGEWLIRDDGIGSKWTSRHNTLLLDGTGQLGEGGDGFIAKDYLATRARPRILAAVSTSQYDHIAGDATQAYPRSLGLKRFVRHLLFVKPDVLLVLDDVLCESEREMELRFHPESAICETAGGSSVIVGQRTTFDMELLTPQGVTVRTERLAAKDAKTKAEPVVIRYSRTGRQWRNAVALSWSGVQKKPRTVTMQTTGDTSKFLIDGKTITFDWELGKSTMEP